MEQPPAVELDTASTGHEPDGAGPRWARSLAGRLPRGRTPRVLVLILALLLVGSVLVTLRQLSPHDDPTAPEVSRTPLIGERTAPPSGAPSPTAPPRGVLRSPFLLDQERDRIIGDMPSVAGVPSGATVLATVGRVLDYYCPTFHSRPMGIENLDEWNSVQVTVALPNGPRLVLLLRWLGAYYRWQSSYQALDRCW